MKKLIGMLGLAAIAVGVSACGGGVKPAMDTRESARDKATAAACDRYQACGLIGADAGAAYTSYDSCSIEWKANFETRWPAATCTAINQDGLAVCINAIGATECTSVVDFLLTLAKCEEVDVCKSAVDAGGQG
jgi:uncharacterized protein DUF6184